MVVLRGWSQSTDWFSRCRLTSMAVRELSYLSVVIDIHLFFWVKQLGSLLDAGVSQTTSQLLLLSIYSLFPFWLLTTPINGSWFEGRIGVGFHILPKSDIWLQKWLLLPFNPSLEPCNLHCNVPVMSVKVIYLYCLQIQFRDDYDGFRKKVLDSVRRSQEE
jgi:hypothetical protein